MKRTLFLPIIALVIATTGCKDDDSPTANDPYNPPYEDPSYRGELISATPTFTFTASSLRSALPIVGADTNIINPVYDVQAYRVVYRTINYDQTETTCSGLMVLPLGYSGAIRLGAYHHGTIAQDKDAPSKSTGNILTDYPEFLVPTFLASLGYVGVATDYLNLGDDINNVHPYVHARSEATSSIDILRAARSYVETNTSWTIKPDGVVLFGYSQGGHATAVTHREMQIHHPNEFPVFAAVPMSGPYDLSGTMADFMLTEQTYPAPFYLPYTMFSYNMVYNMYPSQADYLKPQYVDTLYNLLVNQASPNDLNNAMPQPPIDILLDSEIEDFRTNMEHPLRRALRANDALGWAPQAPTHIFYCGGDDEVPGEHSVVAYNDWRANGAPTLRITNGGDSLDHGGCLFPAFITALSFLDSVENGLVQ